MKIRFDGPVTVNAGGTWTFERGVVTDVPDHVGAYCLTLKGCTRVDAPKTPPHRKEPTDGARATPSEVSDAPTD